jgi:hypothetical protein
MDEKHRFTFRQSLPSAVETKTEVKAKAEVERGAHVEDSPQQGADLATIVSLPFLFCFLDAIRL